MKILDTQDALLPNYEVYQLLVDQQVAQKRAQRPAPGNHQIICSQVLTYLRETPSPLANQEQTKTYNNNSAQTLVDKLRPLSLGLEKGELLQIMNLRPSSSALLSTVVEQLEDRLSEEKQAALLEIIAEVLGRDEPTDKEAIESIENGN
ncbi:RNA polymerase Rpb4-domain-containing protein [Rhypophila decipiens]|uniref:DNA-directed RNA polymerase III subunit RPC9 n=1 Tax=Rhypophila decipiens TaxID=261697 RepID=A0AAN7B4S9_9PEZI|nr:RNA polymerase Rpb4-domain-containing protein [Rhypophila decipiens]